MGKGRGGFYIYSPLVYQVKGIETASIQKPSGGFVGRVIFLSRFVTRGGGFTNWTQHSTPHPLRLGEEVKMAVKVKPNVWRW